MKATKGVPQHGAWTVGGEPLRLAPTSVSSHACAAAKFSARYVAAITPWAVWICPVFWIAMLPRVSPATRGLWCLAAGMAAGIVGLAKLADEGDFLAFVLLIVACGLVIGVIIASQIL